ncbi:MAG: hypothetical protein U5R48_02870 [Gammaproteobacteria bacterium]|nr:hypothetical protein [Gammaproteobacteria bacterium]
MAGPLVSATAASSVSGCCGRATRRRSITSFSIVAGIVSPERCTDVADALRRAVLARFARHWDRRSTVVSGHDVDDAPAPDGAHLAYVADAEAGHLHVVAPPGTNDVMRTRW